ncbi:MAG TPA: hypothetical protein H9881_04700, partial [Candidatus Stackebrandtia excrementipullorum]|nr:hypothetical protein [Candidatus Stackebrandtia excrementipullorum]
VFTDTHNVADIVIDIPGIGNKTVNGLVIHSRLHQTTRHIIIKIAFEWIREDLRAQRRGVEQGAVDVRTTGL